MTNKRPLAPSILNKLDNYLLLNKPEIWSARTHLVIYYGLLFMALLAGICFIIPDDARTSSNLYFWAMFMTVVCIIAIIGWLLFLLRFNVFKRFGNITAFGRLSTFLLYFISVGTIVAFAFVQPAVETIRANKAYSDAEIINDINTINLNICKLEFDSIPTEWDYDTVVVVAKPSERKLAIDYEDYEASDEATVDTLHAIMPYVHLPFKEVTREDINEQINRGDSIIKINDSLYQVYDNPNLRVLSLYRAGKHIDTSIFNSMQLYRLAYKQHKNIDTAALKKEVKRLITKYKSPEKRQYTDDYGENPSFTERYSMDYGVDDIGTSINNVCHRKATWDKENLPDLFRLFFYFTFVISLLVFIFRHTSTKAFFLSLLAAFVLLILSTLLSAFIDKRGIPSAIVYLGFFALFAILASVVVRSKKRNIVVGISINLFVMMVAFVPNIALNLYELLTYAKPLYASGLNNNMLEHYKDYRLYSELLGIVMLIVLIPTYIHWLYRKWFALPQD
ncbi:MAG: hypothetical protein QM541_04990 [Flavobacterium sp.]|nr:hypothetical protein [Flavobacterium sp.]